MPNNIDYDRGVYIQVHNSTGVDVFMYVDEPGIYRNAYGTEVSADLAKEAGYDVERLGKERARFERRAAALDAIDKELEHEDARAMKEVVAEKGGFKIIAIGLGRHQLEDPDGQTLTAAPIPLEQAQVLLNRLVPDPKEEPKEPKQPPAIKALG